MIGGVVGGMYYAKGHLPPQVQAYLGGVTTKSHGGSEYEMVPMSARDDSLGTTDHPVDAHAASRTVSAGGPGQVGIAQEASEDWGDDGWGDDGWGGDEDDQWGGDDSSGAGRVVPISADEARQNARFNQNR